jgi:hypothetical protein
MRHACAVVVLLLSGGCYSYMPVEVHVFEASTGRAISEKTIQAVYNRNFNLFVPDMSPTRTNERGIARLRVCINYGQGPLLLRLGESGPYGPGPSVVVWVAQLQQQDRRPARLEFPVQTAQR